MHLTPEAFDALTPLEWYEIAKEVVNIEESRERAEWQRARLISYYTMCAGYSECTKKSPQELIPFPWDHENGCEQDAAIATPTKLSDDNLRQMCERFGEKYDG